MESAGAIWEQLAAHREIFDIEMEAILVSAPGFESASLVRLVKAMKYAALAPGKRFRPFLANEVAKLFGDPPREIIRACIAVEYVHCFSLVHDDLPALDNDNLRRGQPTLHRKFDEATAILAGDALLSEAFGLLLHPDTHPRPEVRCDLALSLSRAVGPQGMIGGQMIDIFPGEQDGTNADITHLKRKLKTGALISLAADIGLLYMASESAQRDAVRAYAEKLGQIFQLADDVLDLVGDEGTVGKKLQKDSALGRSNGVRVESLEDVRDSLDTQVRQAVECLAIFGAKANTLARLAHFSAYRER